MAAIPFRIETLTTAKGGHSVQSESPQSISAWLSFRDEDVGRSIYEGLLGLTYSVGKNPSCQFPRSTAINQAFLPDPAFALAVICPVNLQGRSAHFIAIDPAAVIFWAPCLCGWCSGPLCFGLG